MAFVKTVYPTCGGTVHIYDDHVPKTQEERDRVQAAIEAACLRAVQEAVNAIGVEAVKQRLMDAKERREK